MLLHVTPIVSDNQCVGTRGIVIDITDRKMAEEKLRASEERFRSLIYNTPEAIWLQDAS
ncbi:MAG: hypothetical protein CW716_04680, partial [Candidatus Bathyarchaeum sp.]